MFPRARVALAAAVAIVVAGVSVTAVSAAPSRHSARNAVAEMRVLDAQIAAGINAARAQHGLQRLRPSRPLAAAAAFHSHEMALDGFFSHDSVDGTSPWARLARFYRSGGYRHWQVGETMLWSSPSVDAAGAVQDWLSSPEHRAILLAPGFREIGISTVHATAAAGSFQGDEVTIVTADFGVRTR